MWICSRILLLTDFFTKSMHSILITKPPLKSLSVKFQPSVSTGTLLNLNSWTPVDFGWPLFTCFQTLWGAFLTFLSSLPPSLLSSTKLKGWDITMGCWSWDCKLSHLSRWLDSHKTHQICDGSKSYNSDNPKDSGGLTHQWRKRCLPSQRMQDSRAAAAAVQYVPCVPAAGRCSRRRRNWSGPPWRRTWAARGHRQHTQSCPPRFWHRQSGNKQTLVLHLRGSAWLLWHLLQPTLDPSVQEPGTLHRQAQGAALLSFLGGLVVCSTPILCFVCFCKRSNQLLK